MKMRRIEYQAYKKIRRENKNFKDYIENPRWRYEVSRTAIMDSLQILKKIKIHATKSKALSD